jgi:hypothetical protein
MARKPLGLHLIDQECLSDEAVEIRDPLIWHGAGPYRWILIDFHELRVGQGR